eukprot:3801003-Pyramimonas_sp.AAC.1
MVHFCDAGHGRARSRPASTAVRTAVRKQSEFVVVSPREVSRTSRPRSTATRLDVFAPSSGCIRAGTARRTRHFL